MLLFLLGLHLLLTMCISDVPVNYKGHQVISVKVQTSDQADTLQQLRWKYDFWTEIGVNRSVDIRCTPEQVQELTKFLKTNGLQFSVSIPDLQMEAELEPVAKGTYNRRLGFTFDWKGYHPLENMYSYMNSLEKRFKMVKIQSIGNSYEGQDMRVAKVCKGRCGKKPAMWIDGGIHAREWISPATVMYLLRELVVNDKKHPYLTRKLDWYFLPVANPDGYLYSQKFDRFWRKTRSPNNGSCYGTDANRNWKFHWGEGGSSNDPCSDTYKGDKPFSEVENRNVRDFLLANKKRIKFFNTIHAYSQMIMIPWGWTKKRLPRYNKLYTVAKAGEKALSSVDGKRYEVGSVPDLLYKASGSSMDWAMGVARIPYSFSMELRPTDPGSFVLPASQIIPTGKETWAFHMTLARKIIREYHQDTNQTSAN